MIFLLRVVVFAHKSSDCRPSMDPPVSICVAFCANDFFLSKHLTFPARRISSGLSFTLCHTIGRNSCLHRALPTFWGFLRRDIDRYADQYASIRNAEYSWGHSRLPAPRWLQWISRKVEQPHINVSTCQSIRNNLFLTPLLWSPCDDWKKVLLRRWHIMWVLLYWKMTKDHWFSNVDIWLHSLVIKLSSEFKKPSNIW